MYYSFLRLLALRFGSRAGIGHLLYNNYIVISVKKYIIGTLQITLNYSYYNNYNHFLLSVLPFLSFCRYSLNAFSPYLIVLTKIKVLLNPHRCFIYIALHYFNINLLSE